jgi:hypothetical protein
LRTAVGHASAIIVGGILVLLVITYSGAPEYVGQTIGGDEPSAASRPTTMRQSVELVVASPMGAGLGMAGPKSTRFGEVGDEPIITSEVWYLNYAMQVGVVGLAALATLVTLVLARLWRSRRRPWSTVSLGIWLGLGVGAIFIPTVDDPSIATPMWVIGAVALALAQRDTAGQTVLSMQGSSRSDVMTIGL